jgi:hypothetical protein
MRECQHAGVESSMLNQPRPWLWQLKKENPFVDHAQYRATHHKWKGEGKIRAQVTSLREQKNLHRWQVTSSEDPRLHLRFARKRLPPDILVI